MRRATFATTVLAVGALVLSGCGGNDDDGGSAGATSESSASSSSSESSASSSSAESAELATADSALGTIVVDSKGMTVYMFDKDTQGSGKSSCSGGCLEAWPPVIAEADSPAVDGVTGDVATITRDDGTVQVTLDGWPLYYWQGDKAAGDVAGQGVQDVWWVLAPDGSKIQTAAPASLNGY
jgi:predicted lipoprotein with Yx(FWY)xxD motif